MPTPIQQIAPGLVHWTNPHPNHGTEVSSYLLAEHGVLIDPILPPDGPDWFAQNGVEPREVLLSCRHHLRDTMQFVERYGCGIHAPRPGMHEFSPDQRVDPYDFGDTLAGGVEARLIGAISPDEGAFVLPDQRAVVVADGVVNWDGLGFVPDHLMGDDPDGIKRGLVAAYARLIDDVDFDHLLCTHGQPVIGNGRAQLAEFVAAMS